jgi:amino-acid N-acetyltransferase
MKKPRKYQLPAIAGLLSESGLPTDDLAMQDLSLFLIHGSEEDVEAVGGLEKCGDTALIRSIATSAQRRDQGIARTIVGELEKLAQNSGLKELYLLTETAEGFFERLGYNKCDRSNVPQSIKESRQFSSLCPDNATIMCKRFVK